MLQPRNLWNLSEEENVDRRILSCCGEGKPTSFSDIERKTGASPSTLRKHFDSLVARNLLRSEGKDYVITEEGQQERERLVKEITWEKYAAQKPFVKGYTSTKAGSGIGAEIVIEGKPESIYNLDIHAERPLSGNDMQEVQKVVCLCRDNLIRTNELAGWDEISLLVRVRRWKPNPPDHVDGDGNDNSIKH